MKSEQGDLQEDYPGQHITGPGQPEIKFINAYAVSRNWGGHEEGGWWYDSGEPLASVPVKGDATEEEIEKEKARLEELIGWDNRGQRRYSVNGGDDFEIYVEEHAAKAFPEVRPHYE